MPLERCTQGGKSGYRWGTKGKCYVGPNSKKQALRQGFAEDPDHFKQEVAKNELATASEVDEVLDELMKFGPEEETFEDPYMEAVNAYVSQKERDKMSESDFGWPEEKKFPIRNAKDVESAAKLLGRAPKEKQEAIKKRIIEIANRRGFAIPESWKTK